MSKIVYLFLFCAFFSYADDRFHPNDPYFQVTEMIVEVVDSSEDTSLTQISKMVSSKPESEIGDVIKTIKEIIAFGKEIYKIVEAGKPVINTKYSPISVLPLETEFGKNITPMKLSHWNAPKFTKFKVTYKNGYGVEVVCFTYNVNMSYGGQFQGKGAYITNAQIVPENVTVAWGYTFNAQTTLVGLTNLGTVEAPVAGATLQLSFSVSTVLKEDRNNLTIFIAGDGTIQQM